MAAWRSARAANVAPLVQATMAARLKQLEDENAKLKKLLAESVMDVATLREMLGKNF